MSGEDGPVTSLASIATQQGVFELRRAAGEDVAQILALLGDDRIGRLRETGVNERTAEAFAAIDVDPNQLLLVAVDSWEDVVATMQVTFIPNLSRNGTLRAQLEAVRVSDDLRDLGLGSAFLQWVVDECRRRGVGLVQLTTDKRRDGARRFYETHGFVASHEGMKLELE
jgi:GNAT superfamily N-acetyltransferase